MLTCLIDSVGVPGCNNPNPLISLNTLPGISIRSLDSLANDDQINFLGVLDDINTRVSMKIESDLVSGIGLNLKSYNEYFCIGRFVEPITLVPAGVNHILQGVVFQFLQSKQLVMNVIKIYFRSDTVQTLDFYVKDLVTGDILDTITAELILGENTIQLNKEYYPKRHSNQLFIGYYADESGYYETTDDACFDDCNCDCNLVACRGGCSIITGYKNLYTKNTYGLSIEWAANCSYGKFICDNIYLLKTAVLYAAGCEYMYEVMGSSRLNKFTATNKEQNEKLLKTFEKKYETALQGAVKNLNLCDDCCFDCIGGVKYRYVNNI